MDNSQVPEEQKPEGVERSSEVSPEGKLPAEELFSGPVYYANFCQALLTEDEAMLNFVQKGLTNIKRPVGVATIYVTLPFLKRLSQSLAQLIKEIEDKVGEIPL